MFYKPVSTKPNFDELEKEIIQFWKENSIFEKSVSELTEAKPFVFYEGPPTANGRPGVHHVLARTFKDLVCRYQTMLGKKVERKAGWDEHGLPVEIEVQKQFNLKSKADIEAMGIAEFNKHCAESTQKYIAEWEQLTERMAYWVDFKNAYRTSDNQYIEKVWGILKALQQKDLLYKGHKIVPWACDSGTVVSQAEVALGYKDVIDESAYIKFQLTNQVAEQIKNKLGLNDQNPVYMLAWTTTPWTLPSNMALAIGPEIEYAVCVKQEPLKANPEALSEREVFDYNPQLTDRARESRQQPTPAEEKLWEEVLRNKQCKGYKFTRQKPIGNYILDFYCSELLLAVEVDGDSHAQNQEYDEIRTQYLNSCGIQVKRYSNEQVLSNIEYVKKDLLTPVDEPPPCGVPFTGALKNTSSFFSGSENPPLSRGARGVKYLILSQKRVKAVLGDEWQIVSTLKGSELANYKYQALFETEKHLSIIKGINTKNECFVIDDENSGTGIVHIAPAFGADDLEAYKANGIETPILNAVTQEGSFNEQAPKFLHGESIFNDNKKTEQKEFIRINKIICKKLDELGLLLKTEKYEHSYPHNWRTNNPLIYYLRPSWYIATSRLREQFLEANEQINWHPEHVKEGRFGQWLAGNIDWSISRERYWGTPLPIWINQKTQEAIVIGSYNELLDKLQNGNPQLYAKVKGQIEDKTFNVHKPYIDEISWTDEKGEWKRVPEVLDCWFDSGSMPIASNNLENPTDFVTADYICEAVDQTRGWFYTLLAIAVALSSSEKIRSSYKEVVCLGHILDKDGQKMSKSKGNIVNPWELFAKFGADPVRWFMVANCSAGNPIRFDMDGIAEVMRRFILPFWNTYAFYVLYANLDQISDEKLQNAPAELIERHLQPIDSWIIARLNQTHKAVTEEYNNFEFSKATQLIEKFVDDLSNVWVRAGRSRFWGSSGNIDLAAYSTLQACLLGICQLTAPCIPLLSETIYQNLKLTNSPESLHLVLWPRIEENTEEENNLISAMSIAQEIINLGRSLRQELKLKIRQPLSQIIIAKEYAENKYLGYFESLILSELNIKQLVFAEQAEKVLFNTEITPELLAEGLARELIHTVQNLRKNSGLEVSDRIKLYINLQDNNLKAILESQSEYIKAEVLAQDLLFADNLPENKKALKLNGQSLEIGLEKIVKQ